MHLYHCRDTLATVSINSGFQKCFETCRQNPTKVNLWLKNESLNLFGSIVLSWSRNGAKFISRTSCGPKSAPNIDISELFDPKKRENSTSKSSNKKYLSETKKTFLIFSRTVPVKLIVQMSKNALVLVCLFSVTDLDLVRILMPVRSLLRSAAFFNFFSREVKYWI